MASKALPAALVLLAFVCGELVIGGHAQTTYIGLPRGGMLPLPYGRGGMQPPPPPPQHAARRVSASANDGPGRLPGVKEDKEYMIHRVPVHDRARPVPVPPTAN